VLKDARGTQGVGDLINRDIAEIVADGLVETARQADRSTRALGVNGRAAPRSAWPLRNAVYAVAAAIAVNIERCPPGCDRSFGPCGSVPLIADR
jgi:hypothetical protein